MHSEKPSEKPCAEPHPKPKPRSIRFHCEFCGKDGHKSTFWEDLWCGEVLAHKFPRLFSFARNTAISVQDFVQADDLDTLFALPLSIEAHEELL
jgi:hypothetical protein